MKAGSKIRIQFYYNGAPSHQKDYTVEEFRYCLGIFITPDDRTAGNFTPLCQLYEIGPESEQQYISNYGEYWTNMVPSWMEIG